jgi:sulfonate transport system substrate-binding protein
MSFCSRRILLAAVLTVATGAGVNAAEKPKEIRIDWATYNPVSMLLKEKGYLERELAKDNIAVRWVQTVSSSNALQFLNAGSIDFGSTAGSAALVAKVNGNPIKSVHVYSKPEWTALVVAKDSKITKLADLKGKKIAMVRGTDPHIFAVRALLAAGLTDKDITPVLVQQHADGGTALIRGDVDAWAGLDPMMAQHEIIDGAKLFYRNADANTWGILNTREEFAKDNPDLVKRVISAYRRRAVFARQLRRAQEDLRWRHQAARRRGRQAAQGAHRAGLQQDRPGPARVDPGGWHCAAEGRRDRPARRRQEVARRPDRRSLRGHELRRCPKL